MTLEIISFVNILEKLAPFGVPGIMAVLWWLSISSLKSAYAVQEKASDKILEKYENVLQTYKTDLTTLSAQYQVALKEMREKYDNNARLVEMFGALTERYGDLAEDAKKLIQTNIQCWQQTFDEVSKRAYCPYPRDKD